MTRPRKPYSRRLLVKTASERNLYVCTCERCGALVNGFEVDKHTAEHARTDALEQAIADVRSLLTTD